MILALFVVVDDVSRVVGVVVAVVVVDEIGRAQV